MSTRRHQSRLPNALCPFFVCVLFGCAGAPWRPAPVSEMLLIAQGPPDGTIGVGIRAPDGTLAGNWVATATMTADDTAWSPPDSSAIIGDQWFAGAGEYRLIIGWLSQNAPPRSIELPLPLRATDDVVLVGIDEERLRHAAINVHILESADDVELSVVDPNEPSFEIVNTSHHEVSGVGFPDGYFGGELIELWPVPHVYWRATTHCGTGAAPFHPLQPGGRAPSGRSGFEMGHRKFPESESWRGLSVDRRAFRARLW